MDHRPERRIWDLRGGFEVWDALFEACKVWFEAWKVWFEAWKAWFEALEVWFEAWKAWIDVLQVWFEAWEVWFEAWEAMEDHGGGRILVNFPRYPMRIFAYFSFFCQFIMLFKRNCLSYNFLFNFACFSLGILHLFQISQSFYRNFTSFILFNNFSCFSMCFVNFPYCVMVKFYVFLFSYFSMSFNGNFTSFSSVIFFVFLICWIIEISYF